MPLVSRLGVCLTSDLSDFMFDCLFLNKTCSNSWPASQQRTNQPRKQQPASQPHTPVCSSNQPTTQQASQTTNTTHVTPTFFVLLADGALDYQPSGKLLPRRLCACSWFLWCFSSSYTLLLFCQVLKHSLCSLICEQLACRLIPSRSWLFSNWRVTSDLNFSVADIFE